MPSAEAEKTMKKMIIAAVMSLTVNLGGMLINYLHFRRTNYLMYSVKTFGGEFMGETGFGLTVSHIYTMIQGGNDTHSLRFNPIGFILSFLIIAAVFYALLLIISALRNHQK